jgi:HK97 gp10 family phage protein
MIKIEVKGFDAILKKFDNLSKESQANVQSALNDWADRTAADAKALVSTNSSDEGALLRSISPVYGQGNAAVVSTSKYAAYIEFGTRKFAAAYVSSLPQDWATYASTFQGKATMGGSFKDLILAIMGWCKRKGIDEKAAYPIARKIIINGIKQRPFLYPSVNKNIPLLIEDLKDIFK